ncbi:hypothetical protein LWC34_24330 [Kibdelosporangium philippinense]|uniref:Uncharacterized protein n=1 Tax=Kibdelosporangium philippinense TaxID=211113 RepID=A0ABS8ZDL0_9PSEU|nr:hypothetical protein [Kibdelosporangium philippinense]MCE7005933.1 hypothetical protein [Kibdelosporangium philippinense]
MKLRILAATAAAAGALAVLPVGIATAAPACCPPGKSLEGEFPTRAQCEAARPFDITSSCKWNSNTGLWELWVSN